MTSPDIHHVAPPLLLRQQLQSLFLKKPLLQLLLRGSETRFCELQMMMTREEQSNTCCCLQEVMWLLFVSYSCRDGDGDGSFCSKVNYRANICSITSPMRPKRGWKDPLHLTNVNRYVMTIVLENQPEKVSSYNVYFRNWTLIPQNQITNIISNEIFLWFSLIM